LSGSRLFDYVIGADSGFDWIEAIFVILSRIILVFGAGWPLFTLISAADDKKKAALMEAQESELKYA